MINSAGLLKRQGLRITAQRERILDVFLAESKALTSNTLEKILGPEFDRVTVYRTLHKFIDNGILHSIPGDDGHLRYALCDDCQAGHHHHGHVHFNCKNCGATTCLEELMVPEIKLPEGYSLSSADLLVSGTCGQCNR